MAERSVASGRGGGYGCVVSVLNRRVLSSRDSGVRILARKGFLVGGSRYCVNCGRCSRSTPRDFCSGLVGIRSGAIAVAHGNPVHSRLVLRGNEQRRYLCRAPTNSLVVKIFAGAVGGSLAGGNKALRIDCALSFGGSLIDRGGFGVAIRRGRGFRGRMS